MPLGFGKLILAQKSIEDSFLPFPCGVCFATNESLQRRGERRWGRFSITLRTDERMKVVRHNDSCDCLPCCGVPAKGLDRFEGIRIIQNSPSIGNAKRYEIGQVLIRGYSNRYPRWSRHKANCRAAILAANPKDGGEDRRPTIPTPKVLA
jgi:hypothetical protein